MPPQTDSPGLARVAGEEFARYFRHLGGRVEKAALAIPEDQLWTRPFAFGNSIGHLVLHLTGNLNHYVGALVAGTGYVRDREHEFIDPEKYPRDEVLARFREAVDLVTRTVESQGEADFTTPVDAQKPIQTRLGLFLVCAAHLNNHVGQMSYLVQALQSSTQEPPVW
jgi:uncharacterized damage-inducible protein DinB